MSKNVCGMFSRVRYGFVHTCRMYEPNMMAIATAAYAAHENNGCQTSQTQPGIEHNSATDAHRMIEQCYTQKRFRHLFTWKMGYDVNRTVVPTSKNFLVSSSMRQ